MARSCQRSAAVVSEPHKRLKVRIGDALAAMNVPVSPAELVTLASRIDPHGKLEISCMWEDRNREIDQDENVTVDGCDILAEYMRPK